MTLHRFLRIVRLRWQSLTQSASLDAELDRELSIHFDELVREQVAAGMPLAEARRTARLTLGNATAITEQSRDHRRVTWLRDVWADVRYGARRLRRRRVFAAVAIGALAIGIGVNATVLSTIDSALLSPLPLPHADRLVLMRTHNWETGEHNQSSFIEYQAWRQENRVFETSAAAFGGARDFGAEDPEVPAERVETSAVTREWFGTLGVPQAIGRTFTAAEYEWGSAAQVMLISDGLWRRRYARDPAVLSRRVRVNGVLTAIIGVMPDDFEYQDRRINAWFPLRLNPAQLTGQGRLFIVIGRLNRGISVAQAQADLERLSRPLASQLPKPLDWRPRVVPLGEAHRDWARDPLAALAIAGGLALAIVCANLSGVLLAQGMTRRHELAMRMALGASRSRVVRQLLVEGILLAAIAGAAAVLVAWYGLTVLTFVMSPPIGSPRLVIGGLTWRLGGGIVALSLVSGLAINLLPALSTLRLKAFESLTSAGGPEWPRGSHAMRNTLVALQIAASVVLLMGAGLALQSFARLAYRDLGFDPRQLMSFQFRTLGPAPVETLARVHAALRTVPGVDAAAGISDWSLNSIVLPKVDVRLMSPPGSTSRSMEAKYFLVTSSFFSTMGTPLLGGREFGPDDDAAASWGVVINESAAKRLWPGGNPIGHVVNVRAQSAESPRTVIGVVQNLPLHRQELAPEPAVYISFLQQPPVRPGPLGSGMFGRMTFVARYRTDPDAIVLAAQRLVAGIDPDDPLIYSGETGELGVPLLELRNYGVALTFLGAAAALVAVIGVYGVIAQTVVQRTKEIAIRVALGARLGDIIRFATQPALLIVSFGLVAGTAGSLTLSRFLSTHLWGVGPTDPATLAAVVVVMVSVASLAAVMAARRAARIVPTEALRSE